MRIKLSPVLPIAPVALTVYKQGDSLTVNGLTLDFSQLPEGATLPAGSTGCPLVSGGVERHEGQLVVTLILPIPDDAPQAARFPSDIVDPADGKVVLPIPEATEPAPSQGYAAIDWDQLVTLEDKAQAAAEQLRVTATAEIAQRRTMADNAIAPLQDAVDLEEATEAEAAALKEWKRYRITLNRLSELASFPDEIDWPAAPA